MAKTGLTQKSHKSGRTYQNSSRAHRHWTGSRWASFAVTLFLLYVEIALYVSSPDPLAARHLVPALILMGLTVAINWNIFPVAMLSMTLWAVVTLLPTFNGNPFMPMFLLCIVVVILNCSLRQILLSFLVPAIAFTITLIVSQQKFHLFSVEGVKEEFVTVALNIALAALAGVSIRFAQKAQEARAQQAELRLARSQAKQLNRDILLAGQMHDNLTNDLTTILTLAYAHTHGTGRDPSGDWVRVSQSADRALVTAHNAIDVLRGHKENTASFARQSNVFAPYSSGISDADNSGLCGVVAFPMMLENVVRKETEELNDLGFSGSANVDRASLPSSVDSVVHDEVVRLVREICANVRRHGSAGGDWSLTIRGGNLNRRTDRSRETDGQADEEERSIADSDRRVLVIVGMNTIDSKRPVIGISGRGLKLHKQAILRLGGSLNTSSDDGIWTIRAVIPVRSDREARL